MGTSKKSTGETLFDLTSYAAVILANLSVRLENGEVKKTRATCGRGYETPLATYDPGTQSWRMSEGICPLVGHLSLANLPPSGMTRSGVLFPQPAWEPLTDATESSSWPTPTTQDHIQRKSTQQKPGSRHSVGLGDAVRMWPTPTAVEWKGRGPNSKQQGLAEMVKKWPTPRAAMGESRNHTVYARSTEKPQNLENKVASEDPSAVGGKLNPMWVEWLMGFPIGWTDLEA